MLVEGFADEVLILFLIVTLLIALIAFQSLRSPPLVRHRDRIRVEFEQRVSVVRAQQRQASPRSEGQQAGEHKAERKNLDDEKANVGREPRQGQGQGAVMGVRRDPGEEVDCPICLDPAKFALETNCGHKFCAACFMEYYQRGGAAANLADFELPAVTCPCCRRKVDVLAEFFAFPEQDEHKETANAVVRQLSHYNRRFSNAPRTLSDLLLDTPVLLRRLWREITTGGALRVVFQYRNLGLIIGAVLYLISPFDIIPEAVFGLVGLLDDLIVLMVVLILLAHFYRTTMLRRRAQQERDDLHALGVPPIAGERAAVPQPGDGVEGQPAHA